MEWLKIAVQVIGYGVTWWIVLAGWRVSNQQNRNRDQRKEIRDQIGIVVDAIREVESNVVAYLTDGEERNVAKYWTVYFGVQQVNSSVVLCALLNSHMVEKYLKLYRQAITDTAMSGPTSTAPVGATLDSTLRTVVSSGNGLIRALEDRYRELYPLALEN